MPNPIKYTTGSETDALKKGNFYIGTGDVGKGPSDVTGYYQGISPSSGGYVIYMNNSGAPGDLSYHNAPTDNDLITFTNNLAGQSYTTVQECLVYYASQTDKVVLNRDYEGIVTDGLVFNLDAGFTPSYPKNGTTWYDVSPSGNNGTLTNSPTFNSNDGGSIVFDGVDDYVVSTSTTFTANNDFTYEIWVKSDQYITGTGMLGNKGYWSTGGEGAVIGNISRPQYVYGYVTTNTGHFDINSFVGPTYGWTHVIMRRLNNDLRFFINGTHQGSTRTISGTVTDVSDKFWVGRYSNNFSSWKGTMSIARVYNRALTQSEITKNYNAQKGRFGL